MNICCIDTHFHVYCLKVKKHSYIGFNQTLKLVVKGNNNHSFGGFDSH